MKKILIPILLTLIIVAISISVTAAQASSVIVDDTVNYATPTVDGVLDDAYLNSLQVRINPPKYAGVDTSVRATVYALYDDNYVYVFYQVINDFTLLSADDDYIQDHPNPSHNDAVELRIGDDLEEHLPEYTGSNAAHHLFYMDAYGKRFSCYEDSIEGYVNLMKGASKITSDTSYNVEMAIPVVNPFHEGDIIQFNFQVDDCQDAEAQKTGYIGLGDNYMQLTDFEIGGVDTNPPQVNPDIPDTPDTPDVSTVNDSAVIVDNTVDYATPTVDGVLDDAYLNSLQVCINPPKYAGVDTSVRATVYALYDDNYVYVFYQVINDFTLLSADDDYIQDHPNPSHNDAVELRIGDDLKEHLPPYTGSNAAHHLFYMDAYGKRFSCYEDSIEDYVNLMKGASKITSDTSYNVEMAIPVVNPFHEGDIIQFNFQVDDCQDAEAQKTGYIGLGSTYMALNDFVIGKKVVEKNTYTVTFTDESQKEVDKGDVISFPAVPNDGTVNNFSGWMTSGDHTVYYPNDEYTVQSDVTFYPVHSAVLTVPDVPVTENTLSIPVAVSNNWYKNSLGVFVEYNKNALELTSVENGNTFNTLEVGDPDNGLLTVSLTGHKSNDGTAFTLNFKVKNAKLLNGNHIKLTYNTDNSSANEVYTLRKDTSKTATNIATVEDATNSIAGYALIDKEIVYLGQGVKAGFINVKRARIGTDLASHKADSKITLLQNIMPVKIIIENYEVIDSGSCGENITYTLDSNGLLTISGSGDMIQLDPWETMPWYSNRDFIKCVIIENGVTSIGTPAFINCTNLTNVQIPDSVTIINSEAFASCTNLESIIIPNGVTKMGTSAFGWCKNLKSINIPKGLTTIGSGIFMDCDSLETITISNNVTTIESCAFADCNNLTSVTIPDSVTSIDESAFFDCPNLTIHGYSGSYAEDYANEFGIPFVAIPENIAEGTIGDTINWAIEADGTLRISGEGNLPDYGRTENQAPWYSKKSSVKAIVVEDGITRIGRYAFYQCSKATSIDIAESVEFIGQFFLRESGITEITIDWDVKLEYFVFGRADKLKTITFTENAKRFMGNLFSNNPLDVTVKAPEGSFAHKYVELYASKYPDYAASVQLTFESTGNAVTPIVEFAAAGENVFFAIYQKANGYWTLEISGRGEMKNFPYISDKNKVKDYKFAPMYYITERKLLEEQKINKVVVGEDITTLGNYAFYKINKCSTITFPDTITYIGNGAFWNFVKLKSFTIPEGVTSLGKHVFNGCVNLETVTIPDSVTKIGEEIFVKCETESITVYTDNLTAIKYLENNYPEITVISSFMKEQARVVGTKSYSLNGAEKSASDTTVNVSPVNSDSTLGTVYSLALADCGLEEYENNTDALIGLDIEISKKSGEVVPDATVLGTLKRAEVTLSESSSEILIDEISYDSINLLTYKDGTVTTTQFTELSDLKYPHVSFALDHEGDGTVDAISVDYFELAKVVQAEEGKYYITADIEADTSTSYISSDNIANGKTLSEGDVFVYADVNGTIHVDEVITPVTSKVNRVTNACINLIEYGEVGYVDGETYLKNSGQAISYTADDIVALLSAKAQPADYYIYNNRILWVIMYPEIIPGYTPALLLYVKEPTEPVYNPETKKIEVFYPAVLLIDGDEVTVNLNADKAIDGKAATDTSVRAHEISADANGYVVYSYTLVNYTIDEEGLYSLYTTACDRGDTVVVAEGNQIESGMSTGIYTIDGKEFNLNEKSVIYYTYDNTATDPSETYKYLGSYTKENIPSEFDPTTTAQETYLYINADGSYTLLATFITGRLSYVEQTQNSNYSNDARLIKYCAENSCAEAIGGAVYYSHLFLNMQTMKNGSHFLETSLSIMDGATPTEAGYFYGWDKEAKKYVKVTVGNTSAVKIATITNVDTALSTIYLDGAVFNVDGVSADFSNGVVVSENVKIWGTAGNNRYTYKTFDVSALAELYELAADNLITLNAAVGVYALKNGEIQIAWIIVDNYYYGTNDNLTKTHDIVSKLSLNAPPSVEQPPIEEIEDEYNLALLLCVKEPSDPVYNEIKHKYEYQYPAVLLIEGTEVEVNLNETKAIDDKAATHEDVRAHEIGIDENGYAIYSYTLVNYTIDRYGAYSLYTTASDFGNTVVVPAGAVISFNEYTGLYMIDGKAFELDEKSVIYYVDEIDGSKQLYAYTIANMPKDFTPVTVNQAVYLRKNSDGVYTLITAVIPKLGN